MNEEAAAECSGVLLEMDKSESLAQVRLDSASIPLGTYTESSAQMCLLKHLG